MSSIQRAMQLSFQFHTGQTRRDGETPYRVHPLKVMLRLEMVGVTDEIVLCAALLHDAMEDAEDVYEVGEIIRCELGDEVYKCCVTLDKNSWSTRRNYIIHVGDDNRTKLVKIADMADNLSDEPSDYQRQKYDRYLDWLHADKESFSEIMRTDVENHPMFQLVQKNSYNVVLV